MTSINYLVDNYSPGKITLIKFFTFIMVVYHFLCNVEYLPIFNSTSKGERGRGGVRGKGLHLLHVKHKRREFKKNISGNIEIEKTNTQVHLQLSRKCETQNYSKYNCSEFCKHHKG